MAYHIKQFVHIIYLLVCLSGVSHFGAVYSKSSNLKAPLCHSNKDSFPSLLLRRMHFTVSVRSVIYYLPILPKPVFSAAPARRNKLSDLQRQLSVLSNIELSTITTNGLPLREILRNEIDDLVASECIFCGEYMINCIDKPFITDEDWDKVMKEWE